MIKSQRKNHLYNPSVLLYIRIRERWRKREINYLYFNKRHIESDFWIRLCKRKTGLNFPSYGIPILRSVLSYNPDGIPVLRFLCKSLGENKKVKRTFFRWTTDLRRTNWVTVLSNVGRHRSYWVWLTDRRQKSLDLKCEFFRETYRVFSVTRHVFDIPYRWQLKN